MKSLVILLALIGQRERQTDTPHLDGKAADVPIDERWHIENEGGRDGAGLCVDSSLIIAGSHQNVYDLRKGKQSRLWLDGKAHDGGSYPEKLEKQLLRVYGPQPKFAQKVISRQSAQNDYELMENLTKRGYAVCSTMNTGELYDGKPIHHWITIQQFRRGNGWTAWVDNNKPGVTFWLQGFENRVIDGTTGWIGWWTEINNGVIKPTFIYGVLPVSALLLFLAALRRRFALCPVAALLLLACVAPARAQCPPGVICPNPANTYANGVANWYPVVTQPQITADWTDGYEVYTDSRGSKFLRARVTSATYGPGTGFFQPDTWAPKQPKPVKPQPQVQDKKAENFGIMIEEVPDRSTAVQSLDPSWNPESVGLNAADVQTHFDKALRSTLPWQFAIVAGATVCFVGAVAFRLRQRRLA